jgi:CHAT domain-containing protein/Tfp pilus assembly protein PilF
MSFKKQILRFVFIYILILTGVCKSSLLSGSVLKIINSGINYSVQETPNPVIIKSSGEIAKLNETLKKSLNNLLSGGDTTQSRAIAKKIIERIRVSIIDDSILYESYYLLGIYNLIVKNYNTSILYLDRCLLFKEKSGVFDDRYVKILYNLGVAYISIGDVKKHEEISSKSLEIEKKINGETSPLLASIYLSLGLGYSELQEYEKAVSYFNQALSIANEKPESVPANIKADIYASLGGSCSRVADFSKAKMYLDKAELLYNQYSLGAGENYINLMNSLAITDGALNQNDEAEECYKKVLPIAIALDLPVAYNIINSYSVFLAENGKSKKGEELLSGALERAKNMHKLSSRTYIEVLINYANFLREYKIDNKKSVESFARCLGYIQMHQTDLTLKAYAYIGYSLSLNEVGEKEKALKVIDSLMNEDQKKNSILGGFSNPPPDKVKADIISLRVLQTKYRIQRDIYRTTNDQKALEAASNTAELIVSILEKVRINISEDNSRLILGDRYRESYLNAIRDFHLLYEKTKDVRFLEKAFEYSEKSKVAGLLASTRELKASQVNIPPAIEEFEKKLQVGINLFNARLTEESSKENPDYGLINQWKENLLQATRSRDSLILIFEKQFPVYYAVKYNTSVAGLKDIPKILGHKGNYINYVLSDTVLYIFVANRKHQQLIAMKVDSLFFKDIRKFRNLLSAPLQSDKASEDFREFQATGYRLYKILVDPVKSCLISDKLIISPDNILSYIPLETLPVSAEPQKQVMYRNLTYLMNSYDISYTYSATFMAESERKENKMSNNLIAFAPDYPEPIDIQAVLMSRQGGRGILNDLPFARQEAEYVSDITGGKLFENSAAKESVYKKESGKYDIIHLAMHTLLNDKNPMNSTLIFSQGKDSIEDNYLKTYEIYGIPLKAKMVVLSSCNTGTGILYSGEGILSLARGFIYSGSQSVVMSMWEIEDKSGTDIVELFYKNLKKGYTKSVALKNARTEFLKSADQLRSHPYFWATLVVYGDNAALYNPCRFRIIAISILVVLFILAGFYFWKRRYS